MKNSKLVSLYLAFDVPARIRLKKWLNSPAHNHREDVCRLFDYLYDLKDFENGALEREGIYRKIFPEKPYSDSEMRHLMSYLHTAIDEFLIYEETVRDTAAAKIQLIKAYDRLNLKKHFEGAVKKVKQIQETSTLRDTQFHFRNYQLYQSQYDSFEGRADVIKPETLQGISDELDLYFISSKLRNACNILTHKKLYKVDYEQQLLDQVISHVEDRNLIEVPAVGVYYCCFKILRDENPEIYFHQLIGMIREFRGSFSIEEMRGLYLYAINFGIRKMNSGHAEYIRKVFDLYRYSLEEKVLLIDGFLSPYTYTNIAATALKLSEYDWVGKFIKKHQSELPEEYRDSFYEYNLAKLCFARKEFKKVTSILNNLQIRDTFMSLESKSTQIKAYYELGEFKLIEYQIDNFRQVLRRREVLTYHRAIFKNFVQFMKRLINLPPTDVNARVKLKQEISDAELTIDKDWLIAKVEAA